MLLLLSTGSSPSHRRRAPFLPKPDSESGLRVSHIVFVHARLWTRGGFSAFATVNNAAANRRGSYVFENMTLGTYTRTGDCGTTWRFHLLCEDPPCPSPSTRTFPPTGHERSSFAVESQTFCRLVCFRMAVLTGVRWCLVVVLVRVSLVGSHVGRLLMCPLACVCRLWRNVCSSHLPIFFFICSWP